MREKACANKGWIHLWRAVAEYGTQYTYMLSVTGDVDFLSYQLL